jgi:hypothetical protein
VNPVAGERGTERGREVGGGAHGIKGRQSLP